MGKLGYTWYPKDHISDPDVMMMTPDQRGVYRDLIDLAYMNNNRISNSIDAIARYCNSSTELVENVLQIKGEKVEESWSIPSCDKRIKLAENSRENGAKGGRPKTQTKPRQNPKDNPDKTQSSEKPKPRAKGKEKEKIKKKENHNPPAPLIFHWNTDSFKTAWAEWIEYKKVQHGFTYKARKFEQIALDGLVKKASSESEAERIIEHAIANGYKGLFSVKDNGQQSPPKRTYFR